MSEETSEESLRFYYTREQMISTAARWCLHEFPHENDLGLYGGCGPQNAKESRQYAKMLGILTKFIIDNYPTNK